MSIKTVRLAGQEARFIGSPSDLYFEYAEHHVQAFDPLAALVDRYITPEAVVLDIGANLGLSTVLLARRAKHVIAYEASPTNAQFLAENLALNGITNVDVMPVAVSDRHTTVRFHEMQFRAGSHVVPDGHLRASNIETVDVPAMPLDHFQLPPIAFIKLDVEAHEPDVLAGAKVLLERDRPLLYMEINIWCLCGLAGHNPGTFVRDLAARFEMNTLSAEGELLPVADPFPFLHDLIVHRGGVTDVVLRPLQPHL